MRHSAKVYAISVTWRDKTSSLNSELPSRETDCRFDIEKSTRDDFVCQRISKR
jgi:hypothetical protein